MQASVIPFDLHSLPRLLENGWLLVNLGGGLVFLGPSATVGLVKLLPLQVGLWGWWLLVLVVVVNLLPLQVGFWGWWLLVLVVVVNLVALVNLGGLVNLVGLWCWGRLDISDSVCKEANLIRICHPFPSKTIGCCSREFGSTLLVSWVTHMYHTEWVTKLKRVLFKAVRNFQGFKAVK